MAAGNDIQRSLGRLEGKLDQLIGSMTHHVERDEELFAALEKRLGSVEKKIWYGSGIAAVGTFILAKISFGLGFFKV